MSGGTANGESGETSPDDVRGRVGETHSDPASFDDHDHRHRQLTVRDHKSHVRLRSVYGWTLVSALLAQLAVVHLIFWRYLIHNGWDVDPRVFITYLATTLGETVGLALIVVQSLFPRGQDMAGSAKE